MGVRAASGRYAQLRPNRFAGGSLPRRDAPVVREGVDEVEAAAGLGRGVGGRGSGWGPFLGARVGRFDAERALGEGESEVEVPAGTWPWRTALALSSAVMRVSVSLTGVV